MKKPSTLPIIAVLLLCAIFSLALPRRATAQNELKREIRLRNKDARVGVRLKEVNPGGSEKPGLWAVLIGVSRYKFGSDVQDTEASSISNLRFADADARAVYDFLRSPEGGEFRDEKDGGHMVLLTDEEATKANVENSLAKLKQARPDDYFVVFIAAHGAILPHPDRKSNKTVEDPYFALHDTDPNDPERTAIRMDSFRDLILSIPAKRGVVLSDTCYSAGIQMAGRAVSTGPRANATYIEEMSRAPEGVGFLWSAGVNESALEPLRLGHGYFTYCLLQALSNADSNGDERVTLKEVSDFVIREVEVLSGGKQHPYYTGPEDLPLAVVPYVGPESNVDQYGALVIRIPDVAGVEVSIDGESLPDKLDSRVQRSVRVKAGKHNLSFVRNGKKVEQQAEVEPRKVKLVEVNLAFTQSNSSEDSLVDAPETVLNVYLSEDKEPSKEAREMFQKGVDSFKKQKFEEAIAQLNQAIKLNDGAYADAYVFLGRAQQTIGLKAEAAASYRRAVDLRASDFETETLLAEAQFRSGKFNVDEIAKTLERIKYRHPENDFVRVVYADVLMWRGRYWDAERELKQAIRSVPTSPPAHMSLARAITSQRSKAKQKLAVEEAQLALDLYEKLNRKQTSIKRGLGRLSISHVIFGGGQYIDYAAMANAHRTFAEACVLLAELDDSIPDPNAYLDRARASIQEAANFALKDKDKNRFAMVLDASAQLYVLKQQPDRAIKEAEQALTLSDMDDIKSQLHYTLFTAYRSDQKFSKAAYNLKRYLALDGGQLSQKDREGLEEELARLNRLKEANKQK
ncbi:MAG TPA: caspase family protein [Blastocatellia bacterium]|jgi:tetratricopeptide (TPR) repeat protein|nr:caspase family protein [Blastocatellia bacterium]